MSSEDHTGPGFAPRNIKKEGITLLFDNTKEQGLDTEKAQAVDYVIVHGLFGNAEKTFLCDTGFYWPMQLKDELPDARVLVYGYQATLELSLKQNTISINDIADNLLAALVDYREEVVEPRRPIVLVAHSLGGLIVKRVINVVHSNRQAGKPSNRTEMEANIYDSVAGLVFLGTPHLGSNVTESYRVALLKKLTGAFIDRPDKVLAALKPESTELLELCRYFEKTTLFTKAEIDIYSYHELLSTAKAGDLIVTPGSANMHYPREIPGSIYSTHTNMVKYSGPQDPRYENIRKVMKRLGLEGVKRKATQDRKDIVPMMTKLLRQAQQEFNRRKLNMMSDESYDTDFTWYLQSPEYLEWSQSGLSTMLWHVGPPGLGKTVLFQHVLANLIEARRGMKDMHIAYFFCSRFQLASSVVVMRSLICQILARDTDAIPAVEASMRLLQHDLLSADSASWNWKLLFRDTVVENDMRQLLQATCSRSRQKTYLLVDGIDEIETVKRFQLLKDLKSLWDSLKKNPDTTTRIFLTSRPQDPRHVPDGIPMTDFDVERRHCLTSLHDSIPRIRADVKDSHEGTNEWIKGHPEYQKWTRAQSSILWIEGEAGSGKSTLAKKMYSTLFAANTDVVAADRGSSNHEDPVAVVHFFDAQEKRYGVSHTIMLRSFLHQILSKEPDYFPVFRPTFTRVRDQNPQQPEWSYLELKAVLLSVVNSQSTSRRSADSVAIRSPQPRPIYFLIDGLDEAENGEQETCHREDLINLLITLCSLPNQTSVKGIVTSRPAHDIEDKLSKFPHLQLQRENGGDIQKIVKSKMQEIHSIWQRNTLSGSDSDEPDRATKFRYTTSATRQVQGKPSPTKFPTTADTGNLNFVEDYILEHSGGIALWVVLVMEDLTTFVKSAVSLHDVKERLQGTPDDVAKYYARIVEDLLSKHRTTDTTLARCMLGWASFTRQRLSLQEFRDAVAIPPGISQAIGLSNAEFNTEYRMRQNWTKIRHRIKYLCGGLMSIVRNTPLSQPTGPDDIVQLLHRTVKDFLLSPKVPQPLGLFQTEGESLVSDGICAYLVFSLKPEGSWSLPIAEWTLSNYEQLVYHLNDRPLLSYALEYLPGHIYQRKEAKSNLVQFLEKARDEKAKRCVWALLEGWCTNIGLLPRVSVSHFAERFRATCLTTAIRLCQLKAVKTLVIVKTNINIADDQDQQPLVVAAGLGHTEVIDLLIGVGASVDGPDSKGLTPLMAATRNGHSRVVELLLNKGAAASRSGPSNKSALSTAAAQGDQETTRILLDKGADNFINVGFELEPDTSGTSTLHRFQAVLDTGADMNIVTWNVIMSLQMHERVDRTDTTPLRTWDGHTLQTEGIIGLTFCVATEDIGMKRRRYRARFVVIKNELLGIDVLLGREFIGRARWL